MGPREKLLFAAETLRKLAAQVVELESKLNNHDKADEAEKIAMDMHQKGILEVDQIKPTAQKWVEEGKDLTMIEEAVKYAKQLPEPTWSGSQADESLSADPESRVVNFIMRQE